LLGRFYFAEDFAMQTNDFLGNSWTYDCMGCAIADQSMLVPGGLLCQTQYFCVHQDPLIPLEGFLVIASKRHIRSISDMNNLEYEDFSKLIRSTHTAIKAATQVEYLTIVQEESSMHLHLWFFPWTQQILAQYGKPSLAKIRDIMADYQKQPIDQARWKVLELSIENIKALMA
jgi:diadenosine tetraphosphate (Ap4A) HIT family hydrolase